MNAIERELKTARGFASCRGDEYCLDEAELELARLLRIEEAAMNLCKVKGRHHSEQAMGSLLNACGLVPTVAEMRDILRVPNAVSTP